ncbi:phage fiber-tail adaptor protein [Deinococcus kurensis]|uniref:phage fiber-tail adaptor protein n=1 Tax=Deinococcus kurensis TaxID=2662757 RepID=UPI0012D31010|nr:hypothetical protein [Deinococcus kurensis]
MSKFGKGVGETLDYSRDWTEWLDGDRITASTWTSDGLTVERTAHVGGVATAWVSGGAVGKAHQLVNRIETEAGRVAERAMTITIFSMRE